MAGHASSDVAFGTGTWSNTQVGIDLVTRGLAFALAAFGGAAIARDRAVVVAAVAAGGALLLGLLAMASSSSPLGSYNFLSLGVLVGGAAIGAVAWRAVAPKRHGTVA